MEKNGGIISISRLDTYSKDSRIIVYTSPRRGLINGQVLHLRCAEDNILIRLLYGGDELGRGTIREASAPR